MSGRAAVLAIDIGEVMTKAAVSAPGGSRRLSFPTRIAMGERDIDGREAPPRAVLIRGGIARVGDVSSRLGFVEREIAPALSPAEVLAALVGGVVIAMGVEAIDVLMLTVSENVCNVSTDDVRSAFSKAQQRDGKAIPHPTRIGVMPPREAALADLILSSSGEIELSERAVKPTRFSVVDCSPRALRIAHVTRGAKGVTDIATDEIALDFAIERAVCSDVEARMKSQVSGVVEAMSNRFVRGPRNRLDIGVYIDMAATAAREKALPVLVRSIASAGSELVVFSGGHATVFERRDGEENDYVSRIAIQSETSIVRGLFRSGKRWGNPAR